MLGLSEIFEVPPRAADEVHIHLGAALSFKNAIRSRNDTKLQEEMSKSWFNSVDEHTSSLIRAKLLTAIDASNLFPPRLSLVIAQCYSSIASLDLPKDRWPTCIPSLLERSTNKEDFVGKTSLEAIGFLCEIASKEAEDANFSLVDSLSQWSNSILTVVISSLRRPSLRLSAARALLNSIAFISSQMEKDSERTAIVRTICEGIHFVEDPFIDEDFINTSIECLSRLLVTYYALFSPYIEGGVGPLLKDLMGKSNPSSIIMSCVEFWTSLAEVELILGLSNISISSLPSLLDILLPLLKDHGDNDGSSSGASGDGGDEWCISMATTTCLELYTESCGDLILSSSSIIPTFIRENIEDSSSWMARDASILLFGSLMDGCSDEAISPLLPDILPRIIGLLSKDPIATVRDSAAWAIGRLSDHHPLLTLSNKGNIYLLFDALLASLKSDSSGGVRMNSCWALHCIISHLGSPQDRLFVTSTTPIDPLYEGDRISTLIVELLSLGGSNSGGPPNNITISALQSLSGCISNLPSSSPASFVENLYLLALQIGDGKFGNDANIITIWTSLIKKMPIGVGESYFFTSLRRSCEILSTSTSTTDIDEEIFLVMSACIEGLEECCSERGGSDSDSIMNSFISDMISLINSYISRNPSCSQGAMGLLGDISRLLGSNTTYPLSQSSFATMEVPFLESFFAPFWKYQLDHSSSSNLRLFIDCITDIIGNLGIKVSIELQEKFIDLIMETYQSSLLSNPSDDEESSLFDLYESLCNALLPFIERKDKIPQILSLIHDFLLKGKSNGLEGSSRLIKASLGLYGDIVLMAGSSNIDLIGSSNMVYWIKEYCRSVISEGGGADGVPEWTLSVLNENLY